MTSHQKNGCSDCSCSDIETASPDQQGTSLDFRVEGMDCPSCAQTLNKNLSKCDDIQKVNVNYSTAKMSLTVDQSVINDLSFIQDVQKRVAQVGFKAEPLTKPNKNGQVFTIEGMDCAACAMTLEKHMQKLPEVQTVKVNFSTGKMQIVHDITDDQVIKEVNKAGYRAFLDSQKQDGQSKQAKGSNNTATIASGILLVLGYAVHFMDFSALLSIVFYAAAIIIGGTKPAKSAYYAIKSRSLDMNVLMVLAAIGAAAIGQWMEGALVVFLFAVGNLLQNRSIDKTRDSIRNLMNLAPSEALVKQGKELILRPVEEITIGDTIVVRPGEKIPLDGTILSGATSVNQAPITGESIPVDKEKGDAVYAGTVNENGSLEISVTKLVEDTTIAKIIHLVEEAQEKKASTQAFVDRFAAVYTPIVFILAFAVMVIPPLMGFGTWGEWLYKGLELLVVACPCALVISTPVAIVSAIGNAAKNGVLIKGGTFLETAGAIKAIAFDKTGTLTEGKPKVSEVIPMANVSVAELLGIVRTIEEQSKHPIAQAICDYSLERDIPVLNGRDFKAIVGRGAQATIGTITYFAGNPKLFNELNVPLDHVKESIQTFQDEGNTLVLVGTKEKVLGFIAVADAIRPITVNAINKLKQTGIEEIVMLTGDNEGTARKIAANAGVDRYIAELMPEDKVTVVKQLQNEGKKVAMVGDGINDAPALATADLGIAMGGAGTDTAMETADIVLMADNLEKLPYTMTLSHKALQVIKQNIWFSLITKLAALVLIFPGFLTLWIAVLSDTGAALVVILNSMRLLKQKK
ncbi:Cd2+/Zn2+-exporting ATPase [Scopulibacillus darangshiensis]|uniref:Cd(2+)-exporting ATPase n=1 Tax=Scopulibacillus darangshiensis TaxID=442528 RepID=A0A4V2SMW7_9BACL|nr:heavy metal translocating P-type ATPase [Scopulibacillus darangshiensis]TCP28896.1 Cd2+/Zn2+-exporting ATPase [Scopulibacillus darangshiensis]